MNPDPYRWYMAANLTTVHRADCTRRSKNAQPAFGLVDADTEEELRALLEGEYKHLRACKHCLPPHTHHSPATSSTDGEMPR